MSADSFFAGDIVINHRCADAQDEQGVWNQFRFETRNSLCCRCTQRLAAMHSSSDT